MTGPFDRWTDDDVADLVAGWPLAWIVPRSTPEAASMMPMLLDRDAGGAPVSLLGHLPRVHPLHDTLAADGDALFLFQGPNAYITPAWLADKDWAPTWNFAVAKIEARVTFDEAATDEALRRLVAHMEAGRAQPWDATAMGGRYESLKARVVGFRAGITRISARFKLGQDERPAVLDQILAGLGDDPLAGWMRRFEDRR